MICPHCGGHIDDVRKEEYSGKKSMQDNKYLAFTLTVGLVREKAILFNDGTDEFWVPISQMRYEDGNIKDLAPGQTVTVEIAEWIAKQKGLMEVPKKFEPPDVGSGPIKSAVEGDDIPF